MLWRCGTRKAVQAVRANKQRASTMAAQLARGGRDVLGAAMRFLRSLMSAMGRSAFDLSWGATIVGPLGDVNSNPSRWGMRSHKGGLHRTNGPCYGFAATSG